MISLERQLRELSDFDGQGSNLLSVYLHTDPLLETPDETEAQLEGLAAALTAGLDRDSRRAVDVELDAVRDYLSSMVAPPAGLAIFSCTPRLFFRIIRLPVEVVPAAYWAKWAHVVPLLEAGDRVEVMSHELPSPPSL